MLLGHPGNQVAFYEIAATLIPLLLFGGVVAERVGPKGENPVHLGLLGLAIVGIGGYAILAELLALDAVITGRPSEAAEILTVIFVFGGMVGVVIALAYPWYKKLRAGAADQSEGEKVRRRWQARVAAGTAGSVFVVVLIASGTNVLASLDVAANDRRSEALSAAIRQKVGEDDAAQSHILALFIAHARVNQQEAAALARHDPRGVIGSYSVELSVLEKRLEQERDDHRQLAKAITSLRHEGD